MTATMNAKRANTRLFITFLLSIVGALMLAPSAFAIAPPTEEEYADDLQSAMDDANYVINTYFDGEGTFDDYCIIFGHSYSSDGTDLGLQTLVLPIDEIYGLSDAPKRVTLSCGGYSTGRINLSNTFVGQSNPTFYFGHGTNWTRKPLHYVLWSIPSVTFATMEMPCQYYGNYSDVVFTRINNGGNGYCNYTQITFTPPIETTDQTYSNAMLQQFLHDNDITVDKTTAWIIRSNGQAVEIPISYDVPVNYNGDFYIKQTQATPYLDRFHLVTLNSDYDTNYYRGSQICIYYPLNVTKLSLYALQDVDTDTFVIDFWDDLPSGSPTSANWLSSTPSNFVFESLSYRGRLLEAQLSENDDYPVYISWEMCTNWLSPIPHFNDLLVALDVTITDSNGNETISRNTTNYTNFVNNYNQKAITGLTGSITGRTSFSGDWRGQNVNTSITYNNNWTMPTDSNVQSLFSRVFTMGNGYVTTAVLGVLAIAFCAYVLYGKH